MKSLLRNFLINMAALSLTARLIPGFTYNGGIRALLIGSVIFMVINLAVVPLLKVLFLPLNLLTLGIFAWIVNVLAVYFLTVVFPQFQLLPFTFSGLNLSGIIIPSIDLTVLHVAILSSFLIGLVAHFLNWLVK